MNTASKKPGLLKIITFIFFLVLANVGMAQSLIKGPVCVTSGVYYQYNVSGPCNDVSNLQICITGGTLEDSTTSCYNGKPVSFIRVSWNDQNTNGNILITSPSGNASLDVNITKGLDPGSIDTTNRYQLVSSGKIPTSISCSLPTGGSCSSSYQYQWQQSYDLINWTDIAGTTNQNLSFTVAVSQITYYRRKVMEMTSGSIAFSNEATVDSN